jgi:hypothetical protein
MHKELTCNFFFIFSHGSNSFIHLAIGSTLLLSSALSPSTVYSSLLITIVGSNDFYSQSREVIPLSPSISSDADLASSIGQRPYRLRAPRR